MKKILFWAAVTMLAAVSCNDKLQNDVPQGELMSFSASVDGAYTKTVIDGMKSYWDGTEGIRVLDGATSKVFEAEVVKTQTATFVEKDQTVKLSGDDYLAVYPESPAGSVTWTGNVAEPVKKFWLPGEQIAVAGSYDPSTHIAMAYAEAGDNNLEFKNVVALVKFTLASDNVTEVCFYGNNSNVITGNFNVTWNEGDPVASKGDYTLTYAKVKAAEGKTLEKGKTYYISVLPCYFDKGFSVETIVDGVKSVKKNSASYTLERNQILDLGELVWVEPAAPTTRTIYFNPGGNGLWDQAGAWFQAWTWGGSSGDAWVTFEKTSEAGIYSAEIPLDRTGMKVYRRSSEHPADSFDDNDKWNNTGDITVTSDKNYLTITGWGGSDWKWSTK